MSDLENEAGTPEPVEATSESTAPVAEDSSPATETIAEAPAVEDSQEQTFFDPSQVPSELLGAYKQMQGSYTRRMQELARSRDKIAAYDQFSQDPVNTIRRLASQYGMSFADAQQVAQAGANSEWQPQDWGEVAEHIADLAKSRVMESMNPVFNKIESVERSNIEAQLDNAMPEWRDYEDQMNSILQEHPTLVNDPVSLARMAIPANVQESKAMQAAMRKLEAKQKAAKVTTGSQTSTPGVDLSKPPKNPTFQQSVEWARKKIQAAGGSS